MIVWPGGSALYVYPLLGLPWRPDKVSITAVVCGAVSSYANGMVETVQPRRFGAGQQPLRPTNSSRRLLAAFDFATADHFRTVVFLTLVSLVFFLPGFFTIPAVDRDEARFAQATKQMVETGDFVDIRFQDDVRYKKPVGIYWMQAAAVETA